jgi:hypothetical protein
MTPNNPEISQRIRNKENITYKSLFANKIACCIFGDRKIFNIGKPVSFPHALLGGVNLEWKFLLNQY